MNALATAAIGNAKMRTQLGWPLMVITIALYSPLGGLPRLVLIAVGLVFLAQQTPGTGRTPDKSGKATPKPRPATPRSAPKRQPASTTTAKPKAPSRAARQRTASGRWAK